MTNKKITLAIVDDHQIVIDGLKSLLTGLPRFEVLVESRDAATLLQQLATTPVDILLTDLVMPGMDGAELSRAVKKLYPRTRIFVLSMNGDGVTVSKMVEDADIAGYALKNIGRKELITALEKIAGGGVYFTDEVLAEMHRVADAPKESLPGNLSNREIEIIKLIEKEYSNKLIADTLSLSERTVETHRKNIFRKTRTSSVIGLVKFAYEYKLI